MKQFVLSLTICLMNTIALAGCSGQPEPVQPPPDRESLIPTGQNKIRPETDHYQPKSVSPEYEDPFPLPYPVNTAGAEDSAFVLPDGKTLYLWFTPDPNKPPEKQLVDKVTGIYVSHSNANGWSIPTRVQLQDAGKLALDGCEFILGDRLWFCSAREGYTGLHWFTAVLTGETWQNWQVADFNPAYEVGELHITSDGQQLYFHSARPGGQGGYDLWVSENMAGEWQPPVNIAAVNSPYTDGWPFVTQDGAELWFTRMIGAPELWRAKRMNGGWAAPEQMFVNFAGEASLDEHGNVYFTHHFYENDRMLEADIYFAGKREPSLE
jgi:hypothetical protein